MNETRFYHIQTYGCQMNEHDSEVLAGILEDMGYRRADGPAQADVILLNTCCVRESAEQRVLGELGRLKRHRSGKGDPLLGVCGCMVMQNDSLEKIRKRAPHVDFVLGTDQMHRLPEFIERASGSRQMLVEREDGGGMLPTDLPRRRVQGVRAWVPIIYGCDNYCTYCIVPYVRGREISRPAGEIRREVELLAEDGVREITLLGQNVNSYGKDLDGVVDFGKLLSGLDPIEEIRRIRYTTSHPRDFDLELVDRIAGLDRVCEHFHLPVQSGSDRILDRMNRGYTRDQYLDLVHHIREVIPGASVTTDVIVGFPGETEEDFQDTYELFREARYDSAFSFLYSPRTGTQAASYGDQVPDEVKKDRLNRLNELQGSISLERNGRMLDTEVTLLIEGPSPRDPAVLRGRTRTNKLVLVPGSKDHTDRFVRTRIIRAEPYQLRGEMLDSS